MTSVLNIAHRGASAHAPENTFAAYDLALTLGADAIELDVHKTLDGELVVLHDETITRTTSGEALTSDAVKSLTWQDISQRDSGSWFNDLHPHFARHEYREARVPRLEEVFERYGDEFTYFIELKHPPCRTGMETEIVELIRRFDLLGDRGERPTVLVAAFSQPCLHALHDMEPDLALVQLFHSYATPDSIRTYLGALPGYCRAVGPNQHSIDRMMVTAARLHGLEVYSWTANEFSEMERLITMGVDGIVTDFPERLETARRHTRIAKRSRVPL